MNKSHPCPLLAAIAFASLTAFPVLGNAAVLFTDNFTGVTNPNSVGYYFYQGTSAGTAWTTATDNTPPLSGTVMSNPGPGTSTNTVAFKQFAGTTLTNFGDSISIALDFHTPTLATADGNFSVTFLNSSQTMTANSFGPAVLTDARGYAFYQVISGTGSATSPAYYDIVNNDPPPYATKLVDASGSLNVNTTLAQTFTLTLTKVATGTQISSQMNGTVFGSFIDTTLPNYTFNTIRLQGATAQVFNFDNIQVATVPEPSSLALLGLTALGFMGWSKRSRRV